MDGNCYFRIGTLAMDAGSVINCTIYENFGYLPWGKIKFQDKLGMVQANFDFRAYTEIEITMGMYDDDKAKSEIVFKADIVSSSISSDRLDSSTQIVDLVFMYRGDKGNLFSSVPSVGYQSTSSVDVIKDILKKKNIKFEYDSKITTMDRMDWLVVNHNVLSAISSICDRSFIHDSALLYSIKLNGEFKYFSLKDVFANVKPEYTFVYTPTGYKDACLNNGDFKIGDRKVIYFNEKAARSDSGLNQDLAAFAVKTVGSNVSKNTIEGKNSMIVSKVEGSRGGGANSTIYQASKSPQIHDFYSEAPLYRKAILASYSSSIEVACENETATSVGSVVDVLDGVYDTNNKFTKSNKISGPHLVMRKGYHYVRGNTTASSTFRTTLHLLGDCNQTSDPYIDNLRKELGM